MDSIRHDVNEHLSKTTRRRLTSRKMFSECDRIDRRTVWNMRVCAVSPPNEYQLTHERRFLLCKCPKNAWPGTISQTRKRNRKSFDEILSDQRKIDPPQRRGGRDECRILNVYAFLVLLSFMLESSATHFGISVCRRLTSGACTPFDCVNYYCSK